MVINSTHTINKYILQFTNQEIEGKYRKVRLPLDLIFLRVVATYTLLVYIIYYFIEKSDIKLYIIIPIYVLSVLFLFFNKKVKTDPSRFIIISFITSITSISNELLFQYNEVDFDFWLASELFSIAIFSGLRFKNFISIIPLVLGGYLYIVFNDLKNPVIDSVSIPLIFSILIASASSYFIEYRGRILFLNEINIKTSNENLHNAYAQLKELDQYKESMTAMIVHDFKNALNTVINFAEGVPTERRLKSIKQAGQFMLNMVMNILDLQKFESASVKMSLASYSLNKLISEAVDQLSYLMEQKAIKLTCEPAGQLYCRVDHDLTIRVIVNILSNAIKYVPQNGKIDILATRQNDFVRIAIRDNGMGIPADKIHSVFEKYVQINAQKSGSAGSTGIGLTFCKMVVESLGGSIGAESEEGKGSTFYFTLPFVNEELSQPLPGAPLAFSKEQHLVLSNEEYATLKPWQEKLRQWEVYDYSEVTAIIEKIENGNGNIALWKEQLMKAVQTGNEGQFSKLVNIEK